jgi:UDP-galactopyranose mutase
MDKNKIEIDLNAILVDVIKLDRNLQETIKNKVKEKIIDSITDKFLDEYYSSRWGRDEKELNDDIVKRLGESSENFVKKVLKDFSEKLSYFSKDKRVKAYEEFKKSVEKLLDYKTNY